MRFWHNDKDFVLMISVAIALVTMLASIIVVLLYRHHTIKVMDTLNQMLDSVISDAFGEIVFDETRLSALECKLGNYLAASQISARNVEKDRNKIKTLVADISHQTKTPISNILLYGELLKERDLDEESLRYVEAMNEQTQKLSFLIKALVKLSRLETGIITVNPVHGDVRDLVKKIYGQYQQAVCQKGLSFIYEKNESSPEGQYIAVYDEKWTMEAIGNIVENSIKYTEKGSICIRIKPYEMFCCIEIEDTGIGIAESEQAQIFSRFYRSAAVSQKQGVGIGLYLAREIITEESGYIKVRSEIFEGSTFSVYLPTSMSGA